MRTAIAQLTVASGISDGAPGPEPFHRIPASRKLNIAGTVREYVFLDELNRPTDLTIRGQMVFDLDKPADKRNWNLLSLLLKMPGYESMTERITLIDPEKDADTQLERDAKELELRTIIAKKQGDDEWLRSVYRRVIGPASGIPARAMAVALTNRAKESADQRDNVTGKYGIDHFLTPSGDWIFQDEYFQTRALLDVALERSIIIRDGEYFKLKSDLTKVLAHDEAKMLYTLQQDEPLRKFISERIAAPTEPKERPGLMSVENSELVRLAAGIGGEEIKPVGDDLSGSSTQSAPDTELDGLIAQWEGSYIKEEGPGLWRIEEVPSQFGSLDEVKAYLKTNPATVENLKSYS